jgi:predicted esterase
LETLDGKMEWMKQQLQQGNMRGVRDIARQIAKHDDPRAIPELIGVIEADNTEDTIYGIGYFALGRLTGVRYDESHHGAWWRQWWEKNKSRYPKEVQQTAIPDLRDLVVSSRERIEEQKRKSALQDVADVPVQDLRAGGDENKRYFLIGGGERTRAPNEGFRLLIVLPGGDGGPDFNPFVRRIYKHALSEDYLVAQLVAPQWSPVQTKQLVWPTKTNPWVEMKFSTEEFVAAVVKEIMSKVQINKQRIFTLAWSSGGPAAYAISLHQNTPVTGSFVAMSVFKPDQLPPLESAKGHAYYILHSPEDSIPMRMPEQAREELRCYGGTRYL